MKLKYKYLKYLFMLVESCCLIPSIVFFVQIMESSEQLQAKERRTNVIKLNVKMRRKQVEKIKHNEIWVD